MRYQSLTLSLLRLFVDPEITSVYVHQYQAHCWKYLTATSDQADQADVSNATVEECAKKCRDSAECAYFVRDGKLDCYLKEELQHLSFVNESKTVVCSKTLPSVRKSEGRCSINPKHFTKFLFDGIEVCIPKQFTLIKPGVTDSSGATNSSASGDADQSSNTSNTSNSSTGSSSGATNSSASDNSASDQSSETSKTSKSSTGSSSGATDSSASDKSSKLGTLWISLAVTAFYLDIAAGHDTVHNP